MHVQPIAHSLGRGGMASSSAVCNRRLTDAGAVTQICIIHAAFQSRRCEEAGSCSVRTQLSHPVAVSRSWKQTRRNLLFQQCTAKRDDTDNGDSSIAADTESQPPYTLLLALAAGGMLETGYLTLSKLLAAPVACPLAGGCDTVLSSGYAELFGIPLSAFGLAAYSAAALLAIWGSNGSLPPRLARLGLLGTGTVLASTSSFLLYTLLTQFPGDNCVWCFTSAALSFSILISAASAFKPSSRAVTGGLARREAQEVAGPSLGLAAAVLAFLGFAFSGVEGSHASFDLPFKAPTVNTQSSSKAIDLAKRLNEAGAKMYGAFWCSHCYDQKQTFGKEAMDDFPYVECYPDGVHEGTQIAKVCADAGLTGFPTWIIDGKTVEGEQTLDKLDELLQLSAAQR